MNNCVICGIGIGDGQVACDRCKRIATYRPENLKSIMAYKSAEVNQLTGLQGAQIRELMREHGVSFAGRDWIFHSELLRLIESGGIFYYKSLPYYSENMSCSRWRRKKLKEKGA